MPRAVMCSSCINLEACKEARAYCSAMNELFSVYNDSKKQVAQAFIDEHRAWLSIEDAEPCEEYAQIAAGVIEAIEELHFIKELEIKIGYVKSYEAKVNKGRIVMADCQLVKPVQQCFIPYDFIITVYEPNVLELSQNQMKALMWHELRHIGINERTLALTYTVVPHEVEDFYSIIERLGMKWSEPGTVIGDITEGVS